MTSIEKNLLLTFLEELSDRFASDGCNDYFMPDTPENREVLIASQQYRGDRDSDKIRAANGELYTSNIVVLDYLAHKLTDEVGRPIVVCLCGSTKFKQQFIQANFRETMAGKIVLSVGWYSHADSHIFSPSETEKAAVDELHLRKIDIADEVLVVSQNGYIGYSTRREVDYAISLGKEVRWLEQSAKENYHALAKRTEDERRDS